uniref:Uncharacterized protein n=1 Tax=Romanomermis culicivorax TaxID=13658 RepID=A0A915I7V7_ROMCU
MARKILGIITKHMNNIRMKESQRTRTDVHYSLGCSQATGGTTVFLRAKTSVESLLDRDSPEDQFITEKFTKTTKQVKQTSKHHSTKIEP